MFEIMGNGVLAPGSAAFQALTEHFLNYDGQLSAKLQSP
jgi:hypothetical protein